MSDLSTIFVTFPTGRDGRDEVTICVAEIASYRSHTVVSYSYEDWTLFTLKNGDTQDCRVKKSEVDRKLREAGTP